MVPLGTVASDFQLEDHNPATHQGTVSLDDLPAEKGFLVAFLCEHCPYVKHIEDVLGQRAREYQEQGVAVVAIASNDLENYPQDGPEGMADQAQRAGFTFPYLLDETQDVAQAYKAACTPDFFLFDTDRELVYRGQFDLARPGNGVDVTGQDLTRAVQALVGGQDPLEDQQPSAGCNIKWKPGNEPEFFQT